jgi:hypothetical protein
LIRGAPKDRRKARRWTALVTDAAPKHVKDRRRALFSTHEASRRAAPSRGES